MVPFFGPPCIQQCCEVSLGDRL